MPQYLELCFPLGGFVTLLALEPACISLCVCAEKHKAVRDAVNAETRGTHIQHLNLSDYLRDENKNGLVCFYCIVTLPELRTVGLSAPLASPCVLGEKGWRNTAFCKWHIFEGQSFSWYCLIFSEKLLCWNLALCSPVWPFPKVEALPQPFHGCWLESGICIGFALSSPNHLLFAPPVAVMSSEALCPFCFLVGCFFFDSYVKCLNQSPSSLMLWPSVLTLRPAPE